MAREKELLVAIVDDESCMTDQIKAYIDRFQEENAVHIASSVFHSPKVFLASVSHDYDLVFLDVEMGDMTGIDVARKIRETNGRVQIIFITRMAQYAIYGYEVEALDYVLKPITYFDFSLKLKKALRFIKRDEDQKRVLDTGEQKTVVSVADIAYIEVQAHYLHYHVLGKTYIVRGTMKESEKVFAADYFARSSHSYLVNLAHVKGINQNAVVLTCGEVPLSRNWKQSFMNAFAKYLGGMR